MLIAIIIAYNLIIKEGKKRNINKDFLINLIFYCVIFGFIGARIYYVLFNLDYYLSYPQEILKIWNGGLAIHGGLIAGFITLVVYCKKYNKNIIKITDIAVVGIIIAQAIGRWGNFFNGEAYGPLTTLSTLKHQGIPSFIISGMHINGAYYLPTFYYESIWDLIGFIFLLLLRKKKRLKVGTLSGSYLIFYSLGRFAIEYLRSDSLMLGNCKVAMLVSVLLIICGIVIIIKSNKSTAFENLYHSEDTNEMKVS
jgi:phosphatidylglycerol:prolipoprotein diacylglycerol transferase